MAKGALMKTRHKQQNDENFPVSSLFIAKELQPLVNDYYTFARHCDDIADSPDLSSAEKVAQLQEIADIFYGVKKYRGNKLDFAARLKNDFMRENLAFSLAGDLLTAFRRDSEGYEYKTWSQLINYCQYSAAPVGRFMLAIHNENPVTYMPAASLCAALQIVNHLQDIKYDYIKLARVYLPQELMKEFGVSKDDLKANKSTPELKQLIAYISDLLKGQIKDGQVLIKLVHSAKLRCQICIILSLTNLMLKKINRGDVLAQEIRLTKLDWFRGILGGICRFLCAGRQIY